MFLSEWREFPSAPCMCSVYYRGADKSLARPGSKQANVSVRMAWIYFGALPCRGKNTWWRLASSCCWIRVRRLTCFLSASVRQKELAIRHMKRSLFPTILSIPLGSRSGNVLSASHRTIKFNDQKLCLARHRIIPSVDQRIIGYVLRASDQRARPSVRVQAIGVFVSYVTATV
jgi:hypothetical protein